jgi:CubicO group peptidase (beta-lactamase class C family)
MIDGTRRLAALAWLATVVAVAATPGDAQLTARIAASVQQGLGTASAAVLVARGEEVLLHEGYGLADAAAQRPIDRETVFAIGSITKLFTATAILKLEQQGRLATGDLLSDHFDGVPADKASITLEQLLRHCAGFGEYVDLPGEGGDFARITKDVAIARVLDQPLRFPPGSKFGYSNAGYTMLAAVIEEASGSPYADYLREQIFEPAKMTRTGFHGERRWKPECVARGRGARKAGDNDPSRWDPVGWALIGNGGMVSTVEDLWRFLRATEDDTILDAARRAKLLAEGAPSKDGGASEGRGWMVGRTPRGTPAFEVAGGDDFGFLAVMRWLPKEREAVIVTSNSAPPRGVLPRLIDGALAVLHPEGAPKEEAGKR